MKPNKIYVFERADGSLWADYKLLGKQRAVFSIDTEKKAERVLLSPGDELPDRVKALALRKINTIKAELPEKKVDFITPEEYQESKVAPWWKFWS